MRVHVKKKVYQRHVREQCLADLKNQASGAWSPTGSTTGVDRNVKEGCMGAEPGVGRPRKGGSVKPHPEVLAARRAAGEEV